MNTIILKGVTIGNNVIIGAGSLVNHDIPDNSVYAGNPAKFITTVEEYFEKRRKVQVDEAFEIYSSYYRRFHQNPTQEIFSEFFWLFWKRTEPLPDHFMNKQMKIGNYDISDTIFKSEQSQFDGYDDFIKYMEKRYRLQESEI